MGANEAPESPEDEADQRELAASMAKIKRRRGADLLALVQSWQLSVTFHTTRSRIDPDAINSIWGDRARELQGRLIAEVHRQRKGPSATSGDGVAPTVDQVSRDTNPPKPLIVRSFVRRPPEGEDLGEDYNDDEEYDDEEYSPQECYLALHEMCLKRPDAKPGEDSHRFDANDRSGSGAKCEWCGRDEKAMWDYLDSLVTIEETQ